MKHFLIILFTLLVTGSLQAQLEKVNVETYYISDAHDATDTIGGHLPEGSTTYRIYIDLKPGYKLNKLFGDAQHNLKFSSDSVFFNNKENGKTFGQDFLKTDLALNTTALDSYLTLGQTTAKKAGKVNYGVPKSQDTDGSFVGGEDNNEDSLLINADPLAGIPLTTKDGNFAMAATLPSYLHQGIVDVNSGADSTIFGSVKLQKEFNSHGELVYFIASTGVAGVIPDSNQILIAQLTTKGKLTFELNLQVTAPNGTTYMYVANGRDSTYTNGMDTTHIVHAANLSYPASCGCQDPHYLEYSSAYVCSKNSDCKTRIVCGCTDSMACNFDPNANVNIAALCCYPGYCNDRDISVVCPALSNAVEFTFYPNPAEDQLSIQISGNSENKEIKYSIYDSYGVLKTEKKLTLPPGTVVEPVDVSNYATGLYWIRVSIGSITTSKLFMKK
jgi:hypothetical protein